MNDNYWDKFKKKEEEEKINLTLLNEFEKETTPLNNVRIPTTDELRFIHKILTNYTSRQDRLTLIDDLIFHLKLIRDVLER